MPGAKDNVTIPSDETVTVDVDVNVNTFVNNGDVYIERATGMTTNIIANTFENNSDIDIEKGGVIFFQSKSGGGSDWKNVGRIEGGSQIYFSDAGVGYYEGKVFNNGVINTSLLQIESNSFKNHSDGTITTNILCNINTGGDCQNNGNIMGLAKNVNGAGSNIVINAGGNCINIGNIIGGDASETAKSGTGGNVEIKAVNFFNIGDVTAGNATNDKSGGAIKVRVKESFEISGTMTSGDGAGTGTHGKIEIHSKTSNIGERGDIIRDMELCLFGK